LTVVSVVVIIADEWFRTYRSCSPERKTNVFGSIARNLLKLLFALVVITGLGLIGPVGTPVYSNSVLAPDQSGWEVWPMPPTYNSTMYGLDMVDGGDGWAGGAGGQVIHWNGSEWEGVATPFDYAITAIDMVDGNSGWGSTYQGSAIRYNGSSWEIQSDVTSMNLTDIYALSDWDVWATGEQGKVFHYSGGSWSEAWVGERRLYGIDMVSPTDGWVVGSQGFTMHYNGSWNPVASGGDDILFDVDMVSSSEGWAVGYDGAIYHYTGNQFTPVSSPTSEVLWSVSMVSADEGWAVGSNGTLLYYDGSQWLRANPDTGNRHLNAVHMVTDSDGWAVGGNGAVLHYAGKAEVSASSKAVSPKHALTGERLTYTIRVENNGNQPASEVVVTDAIPTNTTYVGGSASPAPDSGPDPLVWTVSNLGVGEHVDLTFQVDITGDLGECWFVINEAVIGLEGDDLQRRASTAVGGGCEATHLPQIKRISR
jgi:uncharacterized repeat protein (TIGR01451 family)